MTEAIKINKIPTYKSEDISPIYRKEQEQEQKVSLPKLKELTAADYDITTQENKNTTAYLFLLFFCIISIGETNVDYTIINNEIINISMDNFKKNMTEISKNIKAKATEMQKINNYTFVEDIASYSEIALSLGISVASGNPLSLIISGVDFTNEIFKKIGVWDKIGSFFSFSSDSMFSGLGYGVTKVVSFASSIFSGISLFKAGKIASSLPLTMLDLSACVATGLGAVGKEKSKQSKLEIDKDLAQKEQTSTDNLDDIRKITQSFIHREKLSLETIKNLQLIIQQQNKSMQSISQQS